MALKYLKDNYKGGKGQFIDEHVKAAEPGYSKEDYIKMVRDFVSQARLPVVQNAGHLGKISYISTLSRLPLKAAGYLDKATTDIQKNGLMGSGLVVNDAPKQRVAEAQSNISRIQGQIDLLQSRLTGQGEQQDMPQIKVEQPKFQNPPVPTS